LHPQVVVNGETQIESKPSGDLGRGRVSSAAGDVTKECTIGGMILINTETIHPRELVMRRSLCRGETSNPRRQRKYMSLNQRSNASLSPRIMSVTPSRSSSISDP